MSNFTPEQEQAIKILDRNLIVVAGAGSGKTRVLVERYLHLLENHNWPLNALVAITFTREAALEMRDRVRQSLEERVRSSTGTRQSHWARLLGQMDSARVDTIHALCASILRANAAAARVDPAFEILEPVDADALLADIIDGELRALAEEDDPDGLVQLFTAYEMRDMKAVLAQPNLLHANLGTIPRSAAELLDQWQHQWEAGYQQQVRQIETITGWHLPPEIPEDDKLSDVIRFVDTHWAAFTGTEIDASLRAAAAIADVIKLTVGSAGKWGGKEELKAVKDWLRELRDSIKDMLDTFGTPPRASDLDQRAAPLLLRWLHLLRRIQIAYHEAKAAASYLDFNDLESRTAQLLREHPVVRDRYRGQEFKHLLVDEFQDTNDDQWAIITALVDVEHDPALFLVGDPKQSIYGFRGADVSVFNRVQGEIAGLANGKRLSLTTSFRSHPGLIEPFNHIFDAILQREDNSPVAAYQVTLDSPMTAHRQQQPDPAAKHYAPIEFLLVGHNHHENDDMPLNSDDRRQWEAYEIAQRLQKLVDNKAQIFDKECGELRDFQYGDAALLFQSTTNITRYEAVFKALNIPFVTVAGRGYYDRQEVWDVLNALRALHNPADDLSLAVALRSPMFGFSDDLLLALRRVTHEDNPRKPVPLWQALTQPPHDLIPYNADIRRVERAREILYSLRGIAGRVTISELLRQLLVRTGYLATLTGLPGGARLRRNVEKLVEMAETSGKSTLGAFAHHLGDLTAKEVREGEAALDSSEAVRLMTVHASKGLEFPVVVLVDAGWQRRGGGSDVLVYDAFLSALTCKVYNPDDGAYEKPFTFRLAEDLQKQREEAERKRLLYVAATRARDMLLISGEITFTRKGWNVKGWLAWLMEALTVTEETAPPSDGDQYTIAGTTLRFHLPQYDPALRQALASGGEIARWPQIKVTQDVDVPPLTRPVTIVQEDRLGHIAATQLANLGGYHHGRAEEREYYRTQLRRQVFDDTSGVIQEAARVQEPRIRRRQVGEVVHEALRYWRFPDQHANIEAILRSYAWQQHITDPQQVKEVVERARRLLEQFQRSELYAEMQAVREQGRRWYSELPFIYRTEKRIVHGVIDALYERSPGHWRVIDYKTGIVRGGLQHLEDHARRYHLQLGAYAAAAQQELGGVQVEAAIHYIHYTRTVFVPTAIWQREIQQLESYIGTLIGDHHAQTSFR